MACMRKLSNIRIRSNTPYETLYKLVSVIYTCNKFACLKSLKTNVKISTRFKLVRLTLLLIR